MVTRYLQLSSSSKKTSKHKCARRVCLARAAETITDLNFTAARSGPGKSNLNETEFACLIDLFVILD